jgi:hypothetical protein
MAWFWLMGFIGWAFLVVLILMFFKGATMKQDGDND